MSVSRKWSFFILIAVITVYLALNQVISFKSAFWELNNAEVYQKNKGSRGSHYSCEPCPLYASSEEETEDSITIPLSSVMKGTPIILPQNDRQIIRYIWLNSYIHPPSLKEYNLARPNNDPSNGQGQFVQKVLKNMTNGFFVECGALDGETRSNTLFLEKSLKWEGLLVESDPRNYALLKSKNRKAWTSNTCMATKPYPHTGTITTARSNNLKRFRNPEIRKEIERSRTKEVQCMPLFSLLTALRVTTVDYFSLDVEGSELKVLKTIPFDKVFIRTLSVNFSKTTEGKSAIIKFMKAQDYRLLGVVRRNSRGYANDLMFAHKGVTNDHPSSFITL